MNRYLVKKHTSLIPRLLGGGGKSLGMRLNTHTYTHLCSHLAHDYAVRNTEWSNKRKGQCPKERRGEKNRPTRGKTRRNTSNKLPATI